MEENVEINKIDKEFGEIKIDNVKKFVDHELEKLGLYEKIKNFVDEGNPDDLDEERIIDKIKNAGLIDEIMEKFRATDESKKVPMDNTKKCLYLKLMSGRGFIDYVKNSELGDSSSYFQFDILFFGQRFQSKKIYSTSDFVIDQSFILDFNPLKLELDINFNLLRKISSPIHIVLLQFYGDGERSLVATKSIEWRWALCYGSWKIEAEMYSPSTLNKLNVGSVEIQISLIPFVEKTNLIPERIIFEQLNDEKKTETESNNF
jgi:hypothetical protein